MQVLVVAVQNAVPYSQLGTATSSATFFRSIGGVFGVALFGAIFNSRLLADSAQYLPASALKHISGNGISINPAQINALPGRPSARATSRPSATPSTASSSSASPSWRPPSSWPGS